jgi:hypothetical protein
MAFNFFFLYLVNQTANYDAWSSDRSFGKEPNYSPEFLVKMNKIIRRFTKSACISYLYSMEMHAQLIECTHLNRWGETSVILPFDVNCKMVKKNVKYPKTDSRKSQFF